ncbi:MAG: hypothetical protein IKH14_07030 [Prevotella sp.]|nr:hypothetical protein [Prevotella sp.]
MYESPISIAERITHEIASEKDNQIYKAIAQIGVDVNKEELILALNYDRGQYEKGYHDGLKAAVIHAYWICHPCLSECSNCNWLSEATYKFCPLCGAKMDEEEDK